MNKKIPIPSFFEKEGIWGDGFEGIEGALFFSDLPKAAQDIFLVDHIKGREKTDWSFLDFEDLPGIKFLEIHDLIETMNEHAMAAAKKEDFFMENIDDFYNSEIDFDITFFHTFLKNINKLELYQEFIKEYYLQELINEEKDGHALCVPYETKIKLLQFFPPFN